MFSPYIVPWDDLNFPMKVIRTWLNGWHTSSRCQAARIYPCLFGCEGKRDDLHHYIICPQLYGLCKFFNREISHLHLDRIGLCNPTHETMVHICCAYGAYKSLINYVNSRSDRFYIGQTSLLLIKASDKAWSVFVKLTELMQWISRSMYLVIHFMHGWIGDSTLRIQVPF